MSKNKIEGFASAMPGTSAWTIAVFKAEDVPVGTVVIPAPQVVADERVLPPLPKRVDYREGKTPEYTADQIQAYARAALQTAPLHAQHSDDIAVDRCAVAMKDKLAASRAKGRGGWDDPAQCSIASLSALLRVHVDKSDPLDVANITMMIQQRGGSIAPVQAQEPVAQIVNNERDNEGNYINCHIISTGDHDIEHLEHGMKLYDHSGAVQSVALTDGFEQVRFRFFKNLNSEERKNVFKAFGVWPGDDREGKNIPHAWETLLLRSIFNIAAPAAQGDAQLTEEQVVCALGCIANGRNAGHISTENAKVVREFLRAAIAAKAAS